MGHPLEESEEWDDKAGGPAEASNAQSYQVLARYLAERAITWVDSLKLILPDLDGPASQETIVEIKELLWNTIEEFNSYRYDRSNELFRFVHRTAERVDMVEDVIESAIEAGDTIDQQYMGSAGQRSFRARAGVQRLIATLNGLAKSLKSKG